MNLRRLTFAAALALGAGNAQAGSSVTYDFIEAGRSPNPGMVGAVLTFNSPPAYPNMGWMSSSSADILSFQITDAAIAPVGPYQPEVIQTVRSNDGTGLDAGQIDGGNGPGGATLIAYISTPPNDSELDGSNFDSSGNWVLASASVPEPSSLVLAGLAAMAGLGLLARRRTAPR